MPVDPQVREMLDMRLANGEITREAYDELVVTLSGRTAQEARAANDEEAEEVERTGKLAVVLSPAVQADECTPVQSASKLQNRWIIVGGVGLVMVLAVLFLAVNKNNAPIALIDAATTQEGQPVEIVVLANDRDEDEDNMNVRLSTNPDHGTAEVLNDGRVRYVPRSGFSGKDAFRYTVEDGKGGRAAATVTVIVNEKPNRSPSATDDLAATKYNEETTVSVLWNDSDPDGDLLQVSIATNPSNGLVEVLGGGKIRYRPNKEFSGKDYFRYEAHDGKGGSAAAWVTVTVAAPYRKVLHNTESRIQSNRFMKYFMTLEKPLRVTVSVRVLSGYNVDTRVMKEDQIEYYSSGEKYTHYTRFGGIVDVGESDSSSDVLPAGRYVLTVNPKQSTFGSLETKVSVKVTVSDP